MSERNDRTTRSRRAYPVPPRAVGHLIVLVTLFLLPLYLSSSWLRVGEYIMVGAVAAIGLTLLTGQAGMLSLGTPFFMLVGGTAYCVLAGTHGEGGDDSSLVALGLPPMIALVGAVAIAALLGLLFAPVAGRVEGIYLAIASLALVYIGLYLGQSLPSLTGGTASGRSPKDLSVLGFSFTSDDPALTVLGIPLREAERMWYLFLVLTVFAYFLAQGAVRSRPGRAWRAVRDNDAAAAAMGVQVARVRAGIFATSSAYAGLAGVMLVQWFGLMRADESEFSGSWSIIVAVGLLAMVLIGGLGSIPGAVFGAAIVNGLPLALQLLIPKSAFLRTVMSGDGGYTPVVITSFVYGFAVIAVVLFEPGGLAKIGTRFLHRVIPIGVTSTR